MIEEIEILEDGRFRCTRKEHSKGEQVEIEYSQIDTDIWTATMKLGIVLKTVTIESEEDVQGEMLKMMEEQEVKLCYRRV